MGVEEQHIDEPAVTFFVRVHHPSRGHRVGLLLQIESGGGGIPQVPVYIPPTFRPRLVDLGEVNHLDRPGNGGEPVIERFREEIGLGFVRRDVQIVDDVTSKMHG
jgi:hypothetical protein